MRYYQNQQYTAATNPTHLLNLQMAKTPLQRRSTNGSPTSSNPPIIHRHHLPILLPSLHACHFTEGPASKPNPLPHLTSRGSKPLPAEPSRLLLRPRRRILTVKHSFLCLYLRRGNSSNPLTGEPSLPPRAPRRK